MSLGGYNWLGPFKEGVYLESIGEYLFLGYGVLVLMGLSSFFVYLRSWYSRFYKRWQRRCVRHY